MKHVPARSPTKEDLVDRVRRLVPGFAARAAAAEEARRLPEQSARELLDAGLARILMPLRFGGYGLGLDTWLEVVREISKADASHGWCASLFIHHPHIVGQFSDEAQHAVWADGPDVPIAASVHPMAQIAGADGGYRVSGQNSAFASGVGHSSWVIVGGFLHGTNPPEWLFLLVAPGDYTVRDTWFTAGMRATGSNTIITDNAYVPASRALSLAELRDATGPGAALNADPIFRMPFSYYSPLTFAAPMLGAAQGAYEHFREWTKNRKAMGGVAVAEKQGVQEGMARAAADLDAAELLLMRAALVPHGPGPLSPGLMARSVRDFTRAGELSTAAIDTLVALSGTAGFATSHPIQRAWRDIHFASMHISLSAERNYAHFGRMELGLGRDPTQPFF